MEKFGSLDVIKEEAGDSEEDNDIAEIGETFDLRYANLNLGTKSPTQHVGYTKADASVSINDGENTSINESIISEYNVNINQNDLVDRNMNTNEVARKRNSSASTIHFPNKKAKAVMEPTYRMEPNPNQYFFWFKAKNVLTKLISPLFDNFKYSSPIAGNFCKMVCNKALATVKKKFDCPRYRYVCHVTLFPLNNQGVIVADRSLMLAGIDNYAVCLFTNKEVVMVVTFFGVYYE